MEGEEGCVIGGGTGYSSGRCQVHFYAEVEELLRVSNPCICVGSRLGVLNM